MVARDVDGKERITERSYRVLLNALIMIRGKDFIRRLKDWWNDFYRFISDGRYDQDDERAFS